MKLQRRVVVAASVFVAGLAVYAFYVSQEQHGRRPSLKVDVVPYGVLGTQKTQKGYTPRGEEPDETITIVDPAGLPFIQRGSSGAGGASGSIYQFLRLSNGQFPEHVRKAIRQETDAALHTYGYHQVIHVVGPDFRSRRVPIKEALELLTQSYTNVFEAFISSPTRTLRLLPISGGIFSGTHMKQLPLLTKEAILCAFKRLSNEAKSTLQDANVDLCIFDEKELGQYKAVFAQPLADSE